MGHIFVEHFKRFKIFPVKNTFLTFIKIFLTCIKCAVLLFSAAAAAWLCLQPFGWLWDRSSDEGEAMLCWIWHWTRAEASSRDDSACWTVHSM